MWAIVTFLMTLIICVTILLYKFIDAMAETGDFKELIKSHEHKDKSSRVPDKQCTDDTPVYTDNDFCATYEEDFLQ